MSEDRLPTEELREALDPLPPEALVPVGWIRRLAGMESTDDDNGFTPDLTVPQVAELMGRSPDTVRRWIRSNELRAYEFGREYRVTRAALDGFQESRRNGSHPTVETGGEVDLGRWRKARNGSGG